MDYLEANIVNTKIQTDTDWIYVIIDIDNHQIIHIDSTNLHPVAQVEELLRNNTLNLEVELKANCKLYAFSIEENMNKGLIKKMILNELEMELSHRQDHFEGVMLNAKRWEDNLSSAKEIVKRIEKILSNT